MNKWWICNDGRYDYPHVHDPRRLTQPAAPRRRHDWSTSTGPACPASCDERLAQAGRLAAVLSPFLTVEEAYLLCKFIRGIDAEALLVLGPVPVVGEDERFPKGSRSPRRSVRTAAASRRSSPISPVA